jgi:hypothetical protein
MVEYYKLDKVFVQGTTYETPNDRFFVFKKIGCDQATSTKFVIDGVETGGISNLVAPLYSTSSKLLPPLDLGNLFYVVPPNKSFYVSGASGAKMRAVGLIGVLAPGEGLPTTYASRFTEQGSHYLMWSQGSKLYSSDYTWADGEEISIFSLTPKTIEQYIMNNLAEVETGVASLADGAAALRVYLDGKVLDILTSDPGKKGLDAKYMPRPPVYNGVREPFSFADWPITVGGDHTLELKLINVSGGNLTVAAATDQYIDLVLEYLKK